MKTCAYCNNDAVQRFAYLDEECETSSVYVCVAHATNAYSAARWGGFTVLYVEQLASAMPLVSLG